MEDVLWIATTVLLKKSKEGVPTQPRSYLSTEPGNMRLRKINTILLDRLFARLYQLELMGHVAYRRGNPSKCEFIISGGTFNFYPREYIIWFCNLYVLCL